MVSRKEFSRLLLWGHMPGCQSSGRKLASRLGRIVLNLQVFSSTGVPCFRVCVCVCVCVFLSFLGPHPRQMEIPRLRVYLELWLLAYATATAKWDPSRICNLHHRSWQCLILNPLRKARDQTRNLIIPSWICFCCAMTGTPILADFCIH